MAKTKRTKLQKKPKSSKKAQSGFKTKSGHKLTPQQERFCQLYASDREFFGNGVQSYAEAYGVDIAQPGKYRVACAAASENLTKPYILERIDEIFEAHGLCDTFVDKQLEKLITQDADFKTKLGAIQEYNKMKGRIIERKDVTQRNVELTPILPKKKEKRTAGAESRK